MDYQSLHTIQGPSYHYQHSQEARDRHSTMQLAIQILLMVSSIYVVKQTVGEGKYNICQYVSMHAIPL